jgi:hypothetical protein
VHNTPKRFSSNRNTNICNFAIIISRPDHRLVNNWPEVTLSAAQQEAGWGTIGEITGQPSVGPFF